MPPRFKFTRDEIIDNAISLIREQGESAFTARGLATKLGTSSKPIFGLFENMAELKTAVITRIKKIYFQYVGRELKSPNMPPYKAYGMAYVRMAVEDKELFKMAYFRTRTIEEDKKEAAELTPLIEAISKMSGLDMDKAYAFHLDMWLFVHGIATTVVTSFAKWDMDEVSKLLTRHFERLIAQYIGGKNESNRD